MHIILSDLGDPQISTKSASKKTGVDDDDDDRRLMDPRIAMILIRGSNKVYTVKLTTYNKLTMIHGRLRTGSV